MNIILSSDPMFSVKSENKRKAVKLENKDFVESLKQCIGKYDNVLFISSDPDDYKNNENYASTIEKSLSLSGIKFNYSDVLDSRNWLFSRSLIKNSDLVILLGGDPLTQMEFFNNIELKEKLKGYKGCLMGISAGTVNMASYVYCSKDEDIEETLHYKGLGITNINIEPHFEVGNVERINNVLIPDSKQTPFIALPNESFIVIKDKKTELYGEGYYFKDGNFNKIDNINIILK